MKRKIIICLMLLCTSCLWMVAQEKKTIKVACIGNSITYGSGIKNPFQNSYPGILAQWLGEGYDVRNYGVSARVMLNKGDYPYMREQAFKDVLQFLPDIVTIKLGTNDSKPWNWRYGKDFKKDMAEMIEILQALPSHPQIYVCLPLPCFSSGAINDTIIKNEVIPQIRGIAKKKRLPVIDLYKAMKPHPEFYSDKIHPNESGSAIIAGEIYQALTGKEAPAFTFQPFPGKKSDWNGFDRYDFIYNGREATVVAPQKVAEGRPWIWRPAFFGTFPSVDKALLKKGFHVVYYDLTHLYGSPRSIRLGTDFYQILRNHYNLSSKVTLEGFSRGGLFAFNWAIKNPDKVACIYVDAPVCNLLSWPGRKQADLWKDMLQEWKLTDEAMNDFKASPIDNLTPLLQAHIPVIAVCGDSDQIVPYLDNMKPLADRYRSMGGIVETILKKGCDHHPHSLEQPEPVVDFIVRNQLGYKDQQCIQRRGNLANSYLKFAKEKKGCIAFMGGSITEMHGWRSQIKEDLQQRFPDTQFRFVEAGIGSTGSTPGAFRFENDVLQHATPDLLFVEAAVNDDTNGFNYVAQTRGMEGVVRHALTANSAMDIVMLHFIYDPFIPLLNKGIQPDVILNHERVANYYQVSSINLVQEVAHRMRNGEFDWTYFGGTHPSWEGHKFYTAAINSLFDTEWSGDVTQKEIIPHAIPSALLDPFSYTKGRFMDIRKVKVQTGWKIVEDWTPAVKVGTRNGFVHVPMLTADRCGASLNLPFEGSAIGIFCVAGPQACVLEYSVDGTPFKKIDTFTEWSSGLYLPWVYMFETELLPGKHTLYLRIAKGSKVECQIRNFVVNE